MQNNNCPICRTRIESFIHIKFKEEEDATNAVDEEDAAVNHEL